MYELATSIQGSCPAYWPAHLRPNTQLPYDGPCTSYKYSKPSGLKVVHLVVLQGLSKYTVENGPSGLVVLPSKSGNDWGDMCDLRASPRISALWFRV